jgi:hypothetical protein
MEVFLALAGMGVALVGLSILFNGFPSINITRHYHIKEKKSKKDTE